jgi:galactitol-specific phosphotransferase system IIC component
VVILKVTGIGHKTEIANFDLAVKTEENIAWLEIAMNKTLQVDIFDGVNNLLENW